MEGWVCPVAATAADGSGDLTQLYPAWAAAGVNPAVATLGQQIRQPIEGQVFSLQIQTDGTNGGVFELWDINGFDAGVDVSSGTTITNAQKNTLVSARKAKLIYSQNFIASPETPINMGYKGFQKGLAARFRSSGGTMTANLVVDGGYRYIDSLG